jgi:hypothetical protein
MSIHADLINTGELIEASAGTTQTLMYMVDGVSGDEHSRRTNALKASGLPRMGEPHRTIPSIQVIERRVTPVDDSPGAFYVTVRWGTPSASSVNATTISGNYGPVEWSGRPSSSTVETERDANGTVMKIDYRGKPIFRRIRVITGIITYGPSDYFGATSIARVQKDIGLMDLSASRWERANPEITAATFANFTNNGRWRVYPTGTVLTAGMSFRSDPAGGYRVEYLFTYNPLSWAFEDSISIEGLTPEDARIGNGIKRFNIYPSRDFSGYQL